MVHSSREFLAHQREEEKKKEKRNSVEKNFIYAAYIPVSDTSSRSLCSIVLRVSSSTSSSDSPFERRKSCSFVSHLKNAAITFFRSRTRCERTSTNVTWLFSLSFSLLFHDSTLLSLVLLRHRYVDQHQYLKFVSHGIFPKFSLK